MTTNSRIALILIIALCAILRIIHFEAIAPLAFLDFPFYATETDMFGYWQWSNAILEGDWLGRNTYHPQMGWMQALGDQATWHRWWGDSQIFQQEPVYPYMIAIGRMAGLSIFGLLLAQLLIGALQPLATFWLTRLLFRQDSVALVSALISGIYGPLLFNQGVLLRDWTGPLLGTLMLAAFLHAHEREKDWVWIWPGLLLGFMIMTYSSIMGFLVFLLPWLVWVSRESMVVFFKRTAIVMSGVFFGFLPLFLRNAFLGVAPFSITNRLPEAIVSGLAADNSPLGMNISPSLTAILEKSQGSTLVALVETIKTFNNDWLAVLRLILLKLRAILDPFEIPNNLSYYYAQEISPVLGFLPDYGWLLPLGTLGMLMVILTKRFDHRHGLMLVFVAAIMLVFMLNLVIGRYRLIFTAVLFVYAAWAVWQIWQWAMSRQFKKFTISSIALVALIIVQQVVIPIDSLRKSFFFMHHPLSYHTASEIYIARGRADLALAEWERMQMGAEAMSNAFASDAAIERQLTLHTQLAVAAELTGFTDIADQHVARIDRLFDHRSDQSMRGYVLGVTHMKMGRMSEALLHLEQFIETYPDNIEVEHIQNIIGEIKLKKLK
ncbi:MAG: hypothetical protein ACI9CB_000020 [Rhodothermales bacterium]|jgi:hypothetical protein